MIGTFEGHLTADFPSQINVDVTEYCNLECIHCPYETVTKVKGRSRQHLDARWHARLIDEIEARSDDSCGFIRYTGEGEPLAHPNLHTLIADAAERTRAAINLTTNGMLLDDRRARALLSSGVDVFDVSIDAHSQDVYSRVRVKGKLDVTTANTLRLIELAARGQSVAKVMVSFVRQPLNEHEADEFRRFWTEAGADFVVLRKRHSCAGAMPDMAESLWEAAPEVRKPCLYPWERLVLKPDGLVTFCPADWHHEAQVGHIGETSIASIWSGPEMRALREAHLTGDFRNHALCGQCPDWSVIPWPDEGRNYATVMHEFSSET